MKGFFNKCIIVLRKQFLDLSISKFCTISEIICAQTFCSIRYGVGWYLIWLKTQRFKCISLVNEYCVIFILLLMLWIWLFYYHKCLYISFQINRSDIFQEVEMIFEVHNLGNLLSETKSYEIKDYWKHFYNQIILDLFYLHNKWWTIIQCIYGSAVTNVHLISTLKFNDVLYCKHKQNDI